MYGMCKENATVNYFKSIRLNGHLFEALTNVKQRSYDNSCARLVDDR